jgi:hypothetical protein
MQKGLADLGRHFDYMILTNCLINYLLSANVYHIQFHSTLLWNGERWYSSIFVKLIVTGNWIHMNFQMLMHVKLFFSRMFHLLLKDSSEEQFELQIHMSGRVSLDLRNCDQQGSLLSLQQTTIKSQNELVASASDLNTRITLKMWCSHRSHQAL